VSEEHAQLNVRLKKISPKTAQAFEVAVNAPVQTRTSDTGEHAILTRLCMNNHRAADAQLTRARIMLDQYQGQDFDMAYLGLQVASHSWLLSELEAIVGSGTEEFQAVVRDAAEHVRHHLEQALALSNKLEDDRTVPGARKAH
jgi:hypothetical protein